MHSSCFKPTYIARVQLWSSMIRSTTLMDTGVLMRVTPAGHAAHMQHQDSEILQEVQYMSQNKVDSASDMTTAQQ